ncbi:hypothetical protein GW17_00056102, partial [Ensete ventricosum]
EHRTAANRDGREFDKSMPRRGLAKEVAGTQVGGQEEEAMPALEIKKRGRQRARNGATARVRH